jgi:beta-galactosidase
MLHLFPHWNWQGKEGQEIEVWVHSNCDEVELFLNDKSFGRQTMKKNSHLEWKVKYEAGTLLAKGFTGGKEVLTDKVETTGQPAAIQLTPDRGSINADRQDVSVITVQVNDAQERFVANAGNEITFAIEGPGKIIGVGNGDPSCHEPDVMSAGSWKRSLFNGLAQIIVQSTKDAGQITLTATGKDLKQAQLKIQTQPVTLRPSLPAR